MRSKGKRERENKKKKKEIKKYGKKGNKEKWKRN